MVQIKDLTQFYDFKKLINQKQYLESVNATLSYDMLSTLNSVKELACKIIDDCWDTEIKHKAKVIEQSTKLLTLTLNDLIDRRLIEKEKL